MDTYTTKNDFQLMEIVDMGRRRRLSIKAKRQIVDESYTSGDSVSTVARRHGIFPAQLFGWRRAARDGEYGAWSEIASGTGFTAVRIADELRPRRHNQSHDLNSGKGRFEIVSSNGRRVIVDRDVDIDVLLRIVRGLEKLR
ncbi:transposase [Pararhizobium sp. A13]|uniref:IS66-like element accessory protein TnpA n=1 Tax=Pararhizobium sp. A13 TaxID=3133975 RepID=UPI00311AF518